ncbi:hypothetical protein BpHYR1_010608 [Brachionus plicatilis]|uniref:Uncharacterized protein n=1 Tax=Brachionus plicatilis TaxID=10195 RepID=A0A3M7S6P0_BRAPC|nr:hypothetical protein BpHYR1_010608 [Brachionus plicatilis]
MRKNAICYDITKYNLKNSLEEKDRNTCFLLYEIYCHDSLKIDHSKCISPKYKEFKASYNSVCQYRANLEKKNYQFYLIFTVEIVPKQDFIQSSHFRKDKE